MGPVMVAPEPDCGVLCEVLVRGMLRGSTNNLAQFGLVGFLKQLPNPLPCSVVTKNVKGISKRMYNLCNHEVGDIKLPNYLTYTYKMPRLGHLVTLNKIQRE